MKRETYKTKSAVLAEWKANKLSLLAAVQALGALGFSEAWDIVQGSTSSTRPIEPEGK